MKTFALWGLALIIAIVAVLAWVPPDVVNATTQATKHLIAIDPTTLHGAFLFGSTVVVGPKTGLHPTTYLAGAAVIKNRFVKRGADAQSVILATANSVNLGVAEDDQDTAGRTLRVAHRPGELVTVQASAAIALDALVTSDANGKAVTATTGQNACAVCREAATAADQLVTFELIPIRAAP